MFLPTDSHRRLVKSQQGLYLGLPSDVLSWVFKSKDLLMWTGEGSVEERPHKGETLR